MRRHNLLTQGFQENCLTELYQDENPNYARKRFQVLIFWCFLQYLTMTKAFVAVNIREKGWKIKLRHERLI